MAALLISQANRKVSPIKRDIHFPHLFYSSGEIDKTLKPTFLKTIECSEKSGDQYLAPMKKEQ